MNSREGKELQVGIITLSSSDNCGSLLQTYALQEVIKKNFHCNVEVINFESIESRMVYGIISMSVIKHPKKFIFGIKNYRLLVQQKKDYSEFRKKYLQMTGNKYSSITSLKKNILPYDFVVCGSDQIWNVTMKDFSLAYFLPWVHYSKKIAYAASLGGQKIIKSRYKDKILSYIEDFTSISVREQSGYEELSKYTKKEVSILADPTLLLEPEQWDSLVNDRIIETEYIFFYSWAYCDHELNKLVEQFGKNHNLPIYVINMSKWMMHLPKEYSFILHQKTGPIIFLNLMKYAKYVFVQSLHGAIFASIFKKDFWFLDEHEDDEIDDRIGYLLDLLDQKDRIIRKMEDFPQSSQENIDYSIKNDKLIDLIQKSKDFLADSLLTKK